MFQGTINDWAHKNRSTRSLILVGRTVTALLGMMFTLTPGTANAAKGTSGVNPQYLCGTPCSCWWQYKGICSSSLCPGGTNTVNWTCVNMCNETCYCQDCLDANRVPIGHCSSGCV